MKTNPKPRQTITFTGPSDGSNCHCEFCRLNKTFDAPSELLELFMDGKVVLFAGAGISTEAKGVMPNTFYKEICHILGDNEKSRTFPDAMQEFCSTPAGKVGLIQRISDHFEYAYAHPSIYRNATRFHRELATFFPLDTIVTTNWDKYFEDICAATPFIEDRDVAFWEVATRRVLKIHGSITNYGSIVATRDDYDLCKSRLENGIIGAHLKSLLATRTVVFVGYSLLDDDFLQVYTSVRSALRDFHRQAYFVAPEITEQDRTRLREMNLHLIETDGTFFLSQIKAHAATKRCIAPDQMYDDVAEMLSMVEEAHDWLHETYNAVKYPQILYCSWYQDGMLHALERILRLRSTGQYSDLHRTTASARNYYKFAQRYRRIRNYGDSAYCYGYSNAFLYVLLTREERQKYAPSLFFYFDNEMQSARQYARELKNLPDQHKAAYKYAQSVARKHPYLDIHVMHHFDQLDLSLVAD